MSIQFGSYLDKDHRYQLVRGIDKKVICFLMLNPSNADYANDDPTIKRCKGFMFDLGYSGFYCRQFIFSYYINPKNSL